MKKLLWCGGALGICALILLIVALRNPDNAVLGISISTSAEYSELLVVKRDRTYEQFVKSGKKGNIIGHQGSWLPSKEEVSSRSLAVHTGTNIDNYITYKEMLSHSGSSNNPEMTDSLRPDHVNAPTPELMKQWKEWRSKAQPFSPEDKEYFSK